ncbi:chain length determinant protein EpsF [Methylobacillus methanolivorans]|uniref:Chain length determinant protein EpsF n=1 Tax=Methylobacillus methanolivorans TaxID=1848927 RepID=A0ABW8GH25_9PROT
MNFSQLILILKARYKAILFSLIFAIVLSLIISFLMSPTYRSTATVIVNYKGADPVTGIALPAQLMPGYMATQTDIISSRNVAKKVVATLGLSDNAEIQESFQNATNGQGDINDWLANLLLRNLDVRPSRESSLIDITFSGSNPNFASAIANAFAQLYIDTTIELKVEPSKKAAQYFTEQTRQLRADLEAAQKRLSTYQREKSIVSVDERLDVEAARLNELSSQLVLAQAQRVEAQSRQRNATGRSAYDSPDVAANPIIQNLKTEIARAEGKFADISQKYERNHPVYQGAKAEIDNLKLELDSQIKSVASNVASSSNIFQQREAEIKAALAAQKQKVLELSKDRDELSVLTKDVENAQRAYDITMQRFTATNIEGQSNQSEVAILNPAIPSTSPSQPNFLLNIIIGVVFGFLLGVGLAILLEMIDRRVRSSDELIVLFPSPVFAVIPGQQQKIKKLFNKKITKGPFLKLQA